MASPPPSPSPQPRLRRSPKRQALHERSHSHTNEILAPTIRPVTDEDLKVYAASPFPTSHAQRFPPPRGRRLGPRPPNFGVSDSNTTNATARAQEFDQGSFINAKIPRPVEDDFFAQHGPVNPKPFTANAVSTSRPPAEDREEYQYHTTSSGLDVDRLAMDRGLNVNIDHHRHHEPLPQSLMNPSSSSLHRAGSPHGQKEPPSPRTPSNDNRASLGAIASVASALSLQSVEETPVTVGSADSSGTVVRRKGFTGPTPPGFYSLFPPRPQSQDGSDRQRSSSAPPRPMTMISEAVSSQDSHGSPRSPVSPISLSNESSSSFGRVYYAQALARSETAYNASNLPSNSQPPSRSNSVQARTGDLRTVPPTNSGFSIPRKPVGRSNAVRWNEYMPTIQSQSTDERVDSWVAERSITDGDLRTETAPSSIDHTGRQVSTASAPFPIPESLFSNQRTSQQRVSSGTTMRVVPDRDRELPPIPSRSPERVKSPTSSYSRHIYHDSGNQTESGVRTSKRGSLLRDSVPAWARYSFSFLSDYHTDKVDSVISRDAPFKVESLDSRSPSLVVSKPSMASSNDISSYYFGHDQLRQPESPRALQAVKLGFKIYANIDQRLYYSNEAGNRNTIGRPLSRADSRRYTVASETPARDSIRIPPARPRENRYMQYDPDVIEPVAPSGVLAGSGSGSGASNHPAPKSRRSTRPRPDSDWSPHLYYNRTSAIRRRSMFQAPSIDEESEGTGPSKRNVQIWCFAVGFVFPPGKFILCAVECPMGLERLTKVDTAWIIAAFLPLPPLPRTPPPSPLFERDLEKTLGPADQARHENARWWRNVNRLMSVVGFGVIIAIVSVLRSCSPRMQY